ncbi:MAG: hypothetical protein LBL72_06685 [Candidatus Accumulibacter sp.]|nr:hypothetical protein [Accumulibacter sp.]
MLLHAKLNPRTQTKIANGSTLFLSVVMILLGVAIFFRSPVYVKNPSVLFIALTQCILYFSKWKRMAMIMSGIEFLLVAFFSMMFFSSGPDGGAGRALFADLESLPDEAKIFLCVCIAIPFIALSGICLSEAGSLRTNAR